MSTQRTAREKDQSNISYRVIDCSLQLAEHEKVELTDNMTCFIYYGQDIGAAGLPQYLY
ncbi:hypothetical protein [Viridibacillus soli]|uniref:hypothetical protein n=1 Tax=Viridibacillus soli TaxID=2798301 RepID=UPI001F1F6CAC|nr:hypothetical protein [Viridibacillus soli]